MSAEIRYFEMTTREDFCPSEVPDDFELREVRDPKVNERFYREVGGPWQWTDRLNWESEKWTRWAMLPEVETWLGFFKGKEVGFVEFKKQERGNIEVICFGLLPQMIGLGLGAPMLSAAIKRAWKIPGANRIWLHTCRDDHPHAVPNYEKRGFRECKAERVFTSPTSPST
jgi:GNAT superfamily N-acetyltransferase